MRRRWYRRPVSMALGRATLMLAPRATRDLHAAEARYRRHRALLRTRPGR